MVNCPAEYSRLRENEPLICIAILDIALRVIEAVDDSGLAVKEGSRNKFPNVRRISVHESEKMSGQESSSSEKSSFPPSRLNIIHIAEKHTLAHHGATTFIMPRANKTKGKRN